VYKVESNQISSYLVPAPPTPTRLWGGRSNRRSLSSIPTHSSKIALRFSSTPTRIEAHCYAGGLHDRGFGFAAEAPSFCLLRKAIQ